jgi:hypothetical protein
MRKQASKNPIRRALPLAFAIILLSIPQFALAKRADTKAAGNSPTHGSFAEKFSSDMHEKAMTRRTAEIPSAMVSLQAKTPPSKSGFILERQVSLVIYGAILAGFIFRRRIRDLFSPNAAWVDVQRSASSPRLKQKARKQSAQSVEAVASSMPSTPQPTAPVFEDSTSDDDDVNVWEISDDEFDNLGSTTMLEISPQAAAAGSH